MTSSAGWKMMRTGCSNSTVDSAQASAKATVVWMSWPQEWDTPGLEDAKLKPVCSGTRSASMSARNARRLPSAGPKSTYRPVPGKRTGCRP